MEDALTVDDPFKVKSGGLVDMKTMKGLNLFVCKHCIFTSVAYAHLFVRVYNSKINMNAVSLQFLSYTRAALVHCLSIFLL